MEVGQKVLLKTYDKPDIVAVTTDVGIPSGINNRPAFQVYVNNERMKGYSLFYMEPEPGTGKFYNVGNKAYWVEVAKE